MESAVLQGAACGLGISQVAGRHGVAAHDDLADRPGFDVTPLLIHRADFDRALRKADRGKAFFMARIGPKTGAVRSTRAARAM
jgi:hypothetical protein